MNLNLSKQNRVNKRLFTPKPVQRDGLVLKIHHTDHNSKKTRFINSSFNANGTVVALADNEGNIFAIDLNLHKFWNIPKVVNTCTIVKFIPFRENEVLVAELKGCITLVDIQNGFVKAKLIGHESPVSHISFGQNSLCLSSSEFAAILWDLGTNTKLQVLKLETACCLKYASFTPATNDILTCFNDDVIQIWHCGTFEVKTEIPPIVWFCHEVKNVTFTLDGKIMVIGCRSPHLALFLLSTYKLLKFITLPEHIQTLKHVEFVPQINDGGANKILAILSGRGSIYFYDIDQNAILSELVSEYEISKFSFSPKGALFSCVLSCGDVAVFDVSSYIVVPMRLKAVRAPTSNKGEKLKKYLVKLGVVKEQIREILAIEKLRLILKECGEYPENYRMTIWEHLLELPNNKQQYNAIINHRMVASFEDLYRKYPLNNKACLKNLRQLLDNLVTWCPFFLNVDYLPGFVFPFVKVFANKPLTCFEAVCTVIVNWCQFWFEYFPLPPINILAIIENMLMEQDPELLRHLTKNNITAVQYAWPILNTAFSEVLTAKNWKIFWDHVLTNEPSFLLCAVVSFQILQRVAILGLSSGKQFRCFFSTHHPVDVRRLLSKAYRILATTSPSVHPRQYLNGFRKIDVGEYASFCDYPKTIVDFKAQKSRGLSQEMAKVQRNEADLFKRRIVSLERMENLEVQEEENGRILEMEQAIRQQLLDEQNRVHEYYERVSRLRERFGEDERALVALKSKLAKDQQKRSRAKYLASVLGDVRYESREKDYSLTKVEDELLYHYSELLKNKYKVEQLLNDEAKLGDNFSRVQEGLAEEIESGKSRDHLKRINLETGLVAMDNLMQKIETEMEKEEKGVADEEAANKRILELKAETKQLATEVNNLMTLLADLRQHDMGG